MRDTVNCLREFVGLAEADQPPYLIRMGGGLTTNTATFPDIPYAGTVITAHAGTLLAKLGVKESSDIAMEAYKLELTTIIEKVEANYDDIDLVAQGAGPIVALAGVRGTSTNTSRVGTPPVVSDSKFIFSEHAGQMIYSRAAEKLAVGMINVTYTDADVVVEYSGDTQMKITVGGPDGKVILVDIVTASKVEIKNVVKKTEIFTVTALFNANGISPLANPISIVVPR